jgi:N-sulfoglucosamine sulfohydrolase
MKFYSIQIYLLLAVTWTPSIFGAKYPNILWITAEDMSPTLGCYGDRFATTPNLDKFAARSLRYTNAFASAPVCSPSRSCLINGLPATSQGTHNMRSSFPIPKDMEGFPTLLRKHGFYTTNNVKTDYNSANFESIIASSWDESSPTAHWRNSIGDKPFFSVFNLMTSHQSRTMVWPYEKFQQEVQAKLEPEVIHHPSKVPLPPYYPDTPIIRKHLARYYDCVAVMDKEVGAILAQLKEDQLEEDTIVFFFSDHGSGMPRHKRALLDSGMRVALMVHVPDKWKHLSNTESGTTDQLVSFQDFAPTVLNLLSIRIPTYMEGKPFLGQNSHQHQYLYGHRDRVDEVLDTARSIRSKRYLYIRNFQPHLGYNQPTAWPDLGEIRHEFYRLSKSSSLTPPQRHFVSPTRPVEELYDCIADPNNLNNLIHSENPEYQAATQTLREALFANIKKTRDLGFLPEACLWDLCPDTTPYELARNGTKFNYDQARLVNAATNVGVASNLEFLHSLQSEDANVRYWAAMGFAASSELSVEAVRALEKALSDESISVRIESANALARHGHLKNSIPLLAASLESKNLAAVQHAARTIELLGSTAKTALPAMKKCDERMKVIRPPGTSPVVVQPDKDAAMFILFSTEAFIRDQS